MKNSMKFLLAGCVVCTAATTVMAGLYGDTPNETHAWAVHDMNRPNPKKITADPGKIPSDAIVLFDGTEKTFANWCARDGKPTKWKLVDGTLESVRGAGMIYTKQAFGDCQLHIEWASPKNVKGFGQGRGNSGVFLMSSYEVQVLDSYETDPDGNPNKNPNYADGQASAVYAENPPLVNASRAPGEWQTYDIVFHQPVWEGNVMKYPGSITVFHNGVLTQDHWEMEGLTTHCRRRPLRPHAKKLPFALQDHGNPVHYRNIWIREIPSRYANTTHGGPAVNKADVMALRAKTAAKLFAKIDQDSTNYAQVLNQVLEVISYDKRPEYLKLCGKFADAYLANLAKCDTNALKSRKGEIIQVRNACNVLYRNKVIGDKCKLRNGLLKIIAENGLDKKN